MPRICEIEGCKNPHRARGMCKEHYQQQYWQRLRAESPEVIREYKRNELAVPGAKEKAALRQRALKAKHSERYARYWRDYYAKNREKTLQRSMEWRATVRPKQREELHDSYIKELIQPRRARSHVGRLETIPSVVIEARRQVLKAKRVLKKLGVVIK